MTYVGVEHVKGEEAHRVKDSRVATLFWPSEDVVRVL